MSSRPVVQTPASELTPSDSVSQQIPPWTWFTQSGGIATPRPQVARDETLARAKQWVRSVDEAEIDNQKASANYPTPPASIQSDPMPPRAPHSTQATTDLRMDIWRVLQATRPAVLHLHGKLLEIWQPYWEIVEPAFDPDSEYWRRMTVHNNATFGDHVVLLLALIMTLIPLSIIVFPPGKH